MSKPSDPKWTNAFTRASVEAYLDAADAECVRLQAAIADQTFWLHPDAAAVSRD